MTANRVLLSIALFCFACVPQAMAGVLIGISGDFLYDIDTTTGLASNPRPTDGGALQIAFGNGILYGAYGKLLSTMDPASGESQLRGSISGLGASEPIRDLTWRTETDTLFALMHLGGTTTDRLYTIDRSTLQATRVGDLDARYTTIAFDPLGRLYAINPFLDLLGLIDIATAATISTVPLAADFDNAKMVFTEIGQLIVSADIGGDPSLIFDLDPGDGALSPIGSSELNSQVLSLAFIPEPSTCCLVVFGLFAYLVRRSLGCGRRSMR